jgi:cytochrome c-type biogenesis protein CcmE
MVSVVFMVMVFGGLVLFALLALDDALLYFRVPSDIYDNPPPVTERLRLGGVVKEGSLFREEVLRGEGHWEFVVGDGVSEIRVRFDGVFPDLFREGQGMVAEGYYEDGEFRADLIMAKHDENYVPRTLSGASLLEKSYDEASK